MNGWFCRRTQDKVDEIEDSVAEDNKFFKRTFKR